MKKGREYGELNRIERKRRIASFTLLFAGSLLLSAAIFLSRGIYEKEVEQQGPVSMQKVTISMKNGTGAVGAGLTGMEADRLKKELNADVVCYSAQGDCDAVSGENSKPARVTGTTELAPMFRDISILKGGFFSGADDREGSRVAVIEDRLAWELYRNNDVPGCEIRLFGKRFQIVGVMESDRSVSGNLSDDGSFQVFIPIRTYLELNPDSGITCFQYKTDSGSVIGKNAGDVHAALSSLGRDWSSFTISDYNIRKATVRQKPEVLVLFMGLFLIAVFLTAAIRSVRLTVLRIREECRSDYLPSVLGACRIEIMRSLLLLIFAVIFAILVWKLVRVPVYIPPEWIPDDFTDLSYYTRLIQQKISEGLSAGGNVPPFSERKADIMEGLLNRVFYISLLTGSLLYFAGFAWNRRKDNTTDNTPERSMVTGGIFAAADVFILLITSHAAGLPMGMEVKDLVIYWAFLFTSLSLSSDRGQKYAIKTPIH